MTEQSSKKLTYISMFSGIEAASVAWEPLGFKPIAFAEVDPFPSAVLKKRYPHVPNLGDITKVNWSEYHGKVDIVVGGPPCQAFSVAGLRKALDDPRGVLILEYLRACDQIKPEWIVLENVPGLLSADGGRAFGSLLGALEKLGYHAAWRVLDAQFFGVAQRRRRVFVVAHARDWRRAAAVLFEPSSLFGDYPSSKEAREGFARAAAEGIGAPGADVRLKEVLAFPYGEEESSKTYSIAGNIIGRGPKSGGNGNGFQDDSEPMYTLTTADRHAICQTGTEKSDSFCLNPWATQSDRVFPENSVFPSLVGGGRGNRGYAGGCILEGGKSNEPIIMGSGQANAKVLEGLCPTQCARQHKDPPILLKKENASTLAFDTTQVTSKHNRSRPHWDDPCHTLSCGEAPTVCIRSYAEGSFSQFREGEVGTLRASGGCLGGGSETLISESEPEEFNKSSENRETVRRLTPVECERLQGFPDNWTRVEWNGKTEEQCPNGRRYKAIGNSMAVPVMRWIGEGLLLSGSYEKEQESGVSAL